ncbi:hypothetical protein CLAIMM_00505 [Cladophialophora immunda]|nr:hypothetical protein CLAIMM_00505 [Cladophialophora immunda]
MAPSEPDEGFPATDQCEPLYDDRGYMIQNARGYRPYQGNYAKGRKMRIIHIGAGASGINFAKFTEDRLQNVELQIYEKNHDVGGTWLENRYPGCACDIPSATYQFTWARNPAWSQFYSGAPEIWQYLKDIVDKYDFTKYMKFHHKIIRALWNGDRGVWDITIQRADGTEFMDWCHILINGSGVLNDWKWPDIKGLDTFKGQITHSAAYDSSISLKDKRVAVIGMGSSGVQITAAIAPEVRQLYTWVRSPTWITTGFAQKFAGVEGTNFDYTEDQKRRFADEPEFLLKYSKMIESELNLRFKMLFKNTPEAAEAKEFALRHMTDRLGSRHPELVDALIPKTFGVGCRRATPGNGFLEALTQEHVKVFTSEMQGITPAGFIDDQGTHHEVDVIICATGFTTSWVPRFPIEANGHSVGKMFAKEPISYLSLGVPHMPNYYWINGAYGPLGHGSILPLIEVLHANIVQCIQHMQKFRIQSLTPKIEVCQKFKEHAALFLDRTVWTSGCVSWYKQGRADGPLAMFPGSRLVFVDLMSQPRFEDYEIQYINDKNLFDFLGSGFAEREFDGRDLSHYLGLLNGQDRRLDLELETICREFGDLIHNK